VIAPKFQVRGRPVDKSSEVRMQELLDAREIEGLMIHYFDAVDALDPFGAVEIFSADIEGDFMTGHPYRGRQQIARALGKILLQYESTSHHITNHRAVIDGDHATAFTYIYAFHRMRNSSDTWHLWARHEDVLRRESDGWRVTRRVLAAVDSVPRWDKISDDWYYGHRGRRSHSQLEQELTDRSRDTT
jgi:ketosteroid isomerase-like protein